MRLCVLPSVADLQGTRFFGAHAICASGTNLFSAEVNCLAPNMVAHMTQ